MTSLVSQVIRFVIERRAAGSTMGEMVEQLNDSGETVARRFQSAPDSPANRKIASHIVGIERWAQHRLENVPDKPAAIDEVDGYLPETTLSMGQLSEMFSAARRQTLDAVELLRPMDGAKALRVQHNDFGEITVGAWLMYLSAHAEMECKKIR